MFWSRHCSRKGARRAEERKKKSEDRVRSEKIDCHRFIGMATQYVELLGPDIEWINREAQSLSFLKDFERL